MITFQDFQAATNIPKFLGSSIAAYMRTEEYKIAKEADEYERQRNTAIINFVRKVYDITGVSAPDYASPNNRISSNFLHRLITQRCAYSLGNGVAFAGQTTTRNEDQTLTVTDPTKDELGAGFDDVLFRVGYLALQHGRSYCFYNDGEYSVFPMTEFLPFYDENTGAIRAGVRFWSVDWGKRPITAELFEEDGYTVFRTQAKKYGLGALEVLEEKRHYKETVEYSEADGERVVGGTDYTTLPIAVMYANRAKQSALVGMKANIDAYDLVHSGFANDLAECAQIYWIISNAQGMQEDDIRKLRDRLLMQHMAVIDEDHGGTVTPHTQEVPYNAREACLDRIKNSIFRDFGALDVESISAAAKTATEINAAYQPMDEEADAFEYQVNDFIQQILRLAGLQDTPIFTRNRIQNQKEQTEMVMLAANQLDQETILRKLPFITVDEIDAILARKDKTDGATFAFE